ncbi:PAS domain-containing protein [Pantanalinema rosaneae CENA516]|uniref:PAS domain-containing protein n=1 Tax=Pantanalinema rosaneae TaxID=1620701 RepID=UPI003D6E1F7F
MIQSCVTNSLPRSMDLDRVIDKPSAHTALVIFDDEYRYAHIDPDWAEMNGLIVGEVLGKRISEVLPQLATLVEPMLRKVLLLGQPILGHPLTHEHWQPSERQQDWFVSYYPVRATHGRTIGVISILMSHGNSESSTNHNSCP